MPSDSDEDAFTAKKAFLAAKQRTSRVLPLSKCAVDAKRKRSAEPEEECDGEDEEDAISDFDDEGEDEDLTVMNEGEDEDWMVMTRAAVCYAVRPPRARHPGRAPALAAGPAGLRRAGGAHSDTL